MLTVETHAATPWPDAFDWEARAAEAAGRSIIHMEVGQPGTPAPAGARAALAQAMEDGALGYTVALGLPELRAGIAGLYKRWYGIDLNPERVVVTAGSSAAFLLAFTALFDAGDRVALGEPGYPSYRQILRALSLEPVGIPASEANRLQPVPADLEGVAMRGLIVASPGNPSGTMLSRDALADLIGFCDQRGVSFVSDEIYHGLSYVGPVDSILRFAPDALVVRSARAAVACLRALTPASTFGQIKQQLIQQARDLGGPGKDAQFGYGLLAAPLKTQL